MVASAIKEKSSTIEEYQSLPEGAKYQLIEGNITEMPSPLKLHQKLSFKLTLLLGNFIEENDLGEFYTAPFDVYLGEKNVYQPDLLFVSANRVDIVERRGVMGAPDLVIELLSESTESIDRKKKFRNYQKYGVKEYFIIDPEDNEVLSYYLEDGRYKAAYISYNTLESRLLGKVFEW